MDAISDIRAFSRFYTERIGALEERFLGRDRPLGEARLLYEIGPDGALVSELRDRLDLDSGYASRLLRRLEDDGMVTVSPDEADGRRRMVRLTGAGATEWRAVDELSTGQIAQITGRLGPRRSAELAELLSSAQRLIAAADVAFASVDARSDDAQAAMGAYFSELDRLFVDGFDAGDSLTADCEAYDPPTGAFVLARAGSTTVGCGGLWTVEPGVGEIKRMWIHPDWRGVGLAGRLLADLERRSRDIGHERTILDTNQVLHDAIAMYERAGYHPIERYNDNPYAHHWFEKRW